MATLNASQSIAPSFTPVTSPQIDAHESQGTLHTGPTGVVHRGPEPRTQAELEDNREFLRVAGQVDFGPGEHVLTLVWMSVAYYASLKPERTCFARVDTLAKKAKGVSTRTVQRKLHVLAGLGYITTDHRSGGYRSTYWDVELYPGQAVIEPPTACHPPPDRESPPPRQPVIENHDSVSPDIRDRREGTREKQAAGEVRTEAPSPPATGPAAAAPLNSLPSKQPDEQPDTTARLTCPTCGKSWPSRFGPTCFACPQPTASQLRRREQRERNRESEQDPPLDDAPVRPDPPPITPEERAQLETEAIENGYHKLDDGSWTKSNAPSPQPSPPVEPTATPEVAQKHINDMLDTARNARAPLPRRRRAQGWTKLTDIPSP